MAQAISISITTLDELDNLVDLASALELAIGGFRDRVPDRGGAYGDGLETKATELRRRLATLSEEIRSAKRSMLRF
jgi:hypothetical protein